MQTNKNTQTWAISTETRNLSAEVAYQKVKLATEACIEKLNLEFFYKKIDSTLRGNIAVETLAMLEVLKWDAAIVIPAFPAEGRITVGGYHLLKGVPVERTELARDVHSPIFESHIPTLLKSQLPESKKELVGLIELSTIMKGAGPILIKLNELIKQGKKLIVMDSVSITDIEQVVLAVNKSEYNILAAGSAACAQVFGNVWLPELKNQHISKTIPELPKLIISGSATQITKAQIDKLANSDDFENTYFIDLDTKMILEGVTDELVQRVVSNLGTKNIVVVHTSHLINDFDGFSDDSLNAQLTKSKLAFMITDFLAELTKIVVNKKDLILVTLGGETSYKCCRAIDSLQLQIVDEVSPAIALSIDHKAQWIVAKSGNLGNSNTLVEILNYFEKHD
jgi:uncharacterized protein YgbK (DUF1537 family)